MEQKINPEHPKGNDSINTTRTMDASRAKKPKITKKSIKLIMVGVVVVLLLAVGGYLISNIKRSTPVSDCAKTYTKECALTEAKGLFQFQSAKELGVVAKKVKLIKNYEQDPDLLYVVIIDSANKSDAANTRKYYDMFAKVYKPAVGYDAIIAEVAMKPEGLKALVGFVEAQKAEAERNIYTVQEPR